MARTVATNFSGALQYPYATAGTDLFKKEDVQTLAQAVDQHDHSAGKGLALTAITGAMIAGGTITQANMGPGSIGNAQLGASAVTTDKIADGTIATVDVAINAIQNQVGSYQAVPTFSTTTLSTWITTPIAVTFATTGRPLRVTGQTTLQHSAGGATCLAGLALNGALQANFGLFNSAGVNYAQQLAWTVYMAPAAGVYTIAVQVNTINAGTLAIHTATQSSLYVTEELR